MGCGSSASAVQAIEKKEDPPRNSSPPPHDEAWGEETRGDKAEIDQKAVAKTVTREIVVQEAPIMAPSPRAQAQPQPQSQAQAQPQPQAQAQAQAPEEEELSTTASPSESARKAKKKPAEPKKRATKPTAASSKAAPKKASPAAPDAPATGKSDAFATEWKGSKWMASLKMALESDSASTAKSGILEILASELLSAIARAEARAPTTATAVDESSELEAYRTLAKRDDCDDVIQECLENSIPLLQDVLKSGLDYLSKTDCVSAKDFSDKFAGSTFELTYGGLSTFFGGLELMVGRPKVPILKTMLEEHYHQADSTHIFVTSNYGIHSNSRMEFAFVLYGDLSKLDSLTFEMVVRAAEALAAHDPVEEAAKMKAMPEVVQTAWRSLDDRVNAMESEDSAGATSKVPDTFLALQTFAEEHDRHARSEFQRLGKYSEAPREDPSKLKDPSYARQPFALQHFRREFRVINRLLNLIGEPTLIVEEFIGVRLYTGPMFQKYNGVLRKFTGVQFMIDAWQRDCKGNTYTCTVHVINSALIKLSKLQQALKVYRGMAGGRLPKSFVEANAFSVKGGIEYGFMSTTTNREVAATYAGSGSSGIVFEIQQGMIDRGASLGWASQYPHEQEICFGPLSGLQVVDSRVEGNVLVVEVRLTVNMVSLTIEQVIAKRRSIIEDMCGNLNQEAMLMLRSLEENAPKNARFVNTLKQQVQSAFERFSKMDGKWYNLDGNFKACTVCAIDLREAITEVDAALRLSGSLLEPDEAYKKLLALNLLSVPSISSIVDGAGKVSLPTELDLDRLAAVFGEEDDVRRIFDDIRKDGLAGAEQAETVKQLETFKDVLERNCLEDSRCQFEAERAIGLVAELLKESSQTYKRLNRLERWQQAPKPRRGQPRTASPEPARRPRGVADSLGDCWRRGRAAASTKAPRMGRRTGEVADSHRPDALARLVQQGQSNTSKLEILRALYDFTGQVSTGKPIDFLISSAKTEGDVDIRAVTIRVLARLGAEAIGKQGVEALKAIAGKVVEGKPKKVRRAAIVALGLVGAEGIGAGGIDVLMNVAEKDKYVSERRSAIFALGCLAVNQGIGAKVPALLARLARQDKERIVRAAAVIALARTNVEVLGRTEAVDVLLKAASEDADRSIRQVAVEVLCNNFPKQEYGRGLQQIGEGLAKDYLGGLVCAFMVLLINGDFDAPKHGGVLMELFSNPHDPITPTHAWPSVVALCQIRSQYDKALTKEHWQKLTQTADKDNDLIKRIFARVAHINFGKQASQRGDQVIADLRREGSEFVWVRKIVVWALGSLSEPNEVLGATRITGIDALINAATKDEAPTVRLEAMKSLGNYSAEVLGHRVVDLLGRLSIMDSHEGVREQASLSHAKLQR